MNFNKLSQPDRVSLFRFFLDFVDVGSKSFPQACLFKDIVDGIQSYIGSLLNSPTSLLLRKVPHHNSMPTTRRLGHRRTSAGGSSLRRERCSRWKTLGKKSVFASL